MTKQTKLPKIIRKQKSDSQPSLKSRNRGWSCAPHGTIRP